MASFVKCPMPVNVYLVGLLVYNYITIVFLCVFVVENLVWLLDYKTRVDNGYFFMSC